MIDHTFEIKTKRLIIRFFHESDFEVWKNSLLALPKARNRWDREACDPKDLNKAAFKKILSTHQKKRKADAFYDLVAFDKKTGDLVGFCSLMDISRGIFQNAYLGYRLLAPYWGKGFAKEMVHAIMKLAFTKLKLHRLEAGIEPANKRSIALAKTLGMRREGYSPRRLLLDGKWLDMVIYAITAEEMRVISKAQDKKLASN